MGFVGTIGAGAALLLATVGWRAYTFVRGMQQYRLRAKADTCAMPSRFLTHAGKPFQRRMQFFRINDEVMGGRSSSNLESHSGTVIFTGMINTTGGGFASFRTLGDEKSLGLASEAEALVVKAEGDGQRYKATLHTADSWSMSVPSWSQDFVAATGRQTHRLPLRRFIPSRQGRVMHGLPPLDPAAVTGLGFSLSLYTADGKPNPDFTDGPFRLVVHSIDVEEKKT
mmetsp:Transcript_845/g.1398  ORF Transcript_845/g.1398 Transcript_845/m.1398 type:complete len:226 (-) Transcript_845:290-967(-)|eukprot:CAMPEP_0119315470 /NCGR_PEP_ID=MMETSP1333-20130426/36020_1 /TAXON_ID=418940 /ORGANISM="Scyphosphaera apsteinii, Strain RCC1455" /LENGTH=225 /DNA_ID=CAMNT_0007320841 /DNA_START=78 /DNA_END=755 /DNA_ORIENTATION=+